MGKAHKSWSGKPTEEHKLCKLKEKVIWLIQGYCKSESELQELTNKILVLFESQEEQWSNHGSEMMAAQIRKAIEAGIGRFLNEDANWILDRIIDIQEKGRQLLSYWQERALKAEGINEGGIDERG